MSANGSNNFLNIEDANLRVRSGSVHAQGMTIGGITVGTAHGLQSVTDTSNTTSNTLQFTNATTAFKATSNIELTSATKIIVDSNVVTEYTGLATTLKSVYDVPATTGTQLEVYYDAKDLTTMPSIVTDLAGGDQNGTVTGHSPTLDSTNGIDSFKFNGSSQYITSTHGLSVPGQPIHSQCVWFKTTGDTGDYQYISIIGTTTTDQQAAIIIKDDGTTLMGSYYGGDRTMITITPNVWYHVALVYTGTTTDAAKYYVNGEEVITTSTFGAAPTTPTITGTTLRLGANTVNGQFLQGSIANFRLYSKVLSADQIKELYDFQKDYFLGSKSQLTLYKGHLGVGVTEPSGQLELAGDERLQEYPPRALRQYTTHVEGHGVFTARASAELNQTGDNDRAWKLFTKIADNSNYWTPTGGTTTYGYSSSDGYTTAYHETAGVKGHWVQLQLPYKIKLHSVKIAAGISTRQAKDATVFGSNDGGNTWTSVGGWTDNNVDDFTLVTFSMNNVGYYSLYRLVITRNGGNDATTLSELQFFGTPGPTTLDKGSLSLTRSLDVPRVSRYDVDTETPRPEKLVLDLDTTVNSSPTDISGQGNHGAFYGNAQYSPADKAFKFDGSTDYIKGNLNNTGDTDFTVSLWLKKNTSGTVGMLWNFGGSGGSGNPEDSVALEVASNNNLDYFIFSGAQGAISNFGVDYLGKWVHIVATRSGNNLEIYLDGVDQNLAITGTDTLQLAANTEYTIGARGTGALGNNSLNGCISNFKVYNVVLEPSEIRKLYNLGRTGRSMVISDTAVGIGKAPEAQLDVRGNLRVGGRGIIETLAPRYYSSMQRGTFHNVSSHIITGFDHQAEGYATPVLGWEVHINFNHHRNMATHVEIDGGYLSTATGTHVAISEVGTRKYDQHNSAFTFYTDRFYIGSDIAHAHAAVYAVIRITNSQVPGIPSAIHAGNGATVRYHMLGHTMYVKPGIGSCLDVAIGQIPGGNNARLHGIRVATGADNITGSYTVYTYH